MTGNRFIQARGFHRLAGASGAGIVVPLQGLHSRGGGRRHLEKRVCGPRLHRCRRASRGRLYGLCCCCCCCCCCCPLRLLRRKQPPTGAPCCSGRHCHAIPCNGRATLPPARRCCCCRCCLLGPCCGRCHLGGDEGGEGREGGLGGEQGGGVDGPPASEGEDLLVLLLGRTATATAAAGLIRA